MTDYIQIMKLISSMEITERHPRKKCIRLEALWREEAYSEMDVIDLESQEQCSNVVH